MLDGGRQEIEALLGRIRDGDRSALDGLFQLVYQDLRAVAQNLMVGERPDHTLQPSALVHEAFLKVFGNEALKVCDRAYFFAAQARAMKQLLIEHARSRNADKRPYARKRVPLDDLLEALESGHRVSVLDLDAAMEELKARCERQYDVVRLRFFGGLKWSEIADVLGISVSMAEKDWRASRAWLCARLEGGPDDR